MPTIIPRTGPIMYGRLSAPSVSATAGFKIPSDAADAAIAIPTNNEPPITKPDNMLETFPYTTAAIPIPNTIAPANSANPTARDKDCVGSDPIAGWNMRPITNADRAPAVCAIIYQIASRSDIFRIDNNPKVTAGLIWAPEIDPNIYTNKASVVPATNGAAMNAGLNAESAITRANNPVATNSVKYFLI